MLSYFYLHLCVALFFKFRYHNEGFYSCWFTCSSSHYTLGSVDKNVNWKGPAYSACPAARDESWSSMPADTPSDLFPSRVTLVSELESSTDSGKWMNLRKKICLTTCLTSFNFKLSHPQNETKYNCIPHEVLVWSRLDWKVTSWESVRAFGEKCWVSLRGWCLDLNGAAVAQVPSMALPGVHTIAETWTPGFVI